MNSGSKATFLWGHSIIIISNHNLLVMKADEYTGYLSWVVFLKLTAVPDTSYLPSSGGEVIHQELVSEGSVD